MENKVLGIELGSSNIKIVDIRKKAKGLLVHSAAVIPTPVGSINDGEILDFDKVQEAIGSTLKLKKINTEAVAVLIRSSQVIIREVIMKANNEKEIGALLHYSAGEYIPVDVTQYELSYKILETLEDEEGKKQRLLLTATPKTIVAEVIRLITKLKLRGVGLYAHRDAISVAFQKDSGIVGNTEENCVVVDLGGSGVTFTIVSDNSGITHQQIPFGFDMINDWISQNFEEKSASELEGFKQKYAVIYDEHEVPLEDSTGAYMSALIKPSIDRQVIGDLIRFMELHEKRTSGQARLTKIYLVGGGSNLKNLAAYIEKVVGLPTEQVLTPTGVLTNDREETEMYMPYLIGAIAATTGKGLNRLPAYYFKSRKSKHYIYIGLGLVLLESLIFSYKAYQPIYQEKQAKEELIEVEKALQDLKFEEVRGLNQTLEQEKQGKATWDSVISQLQSPAFIEVSLLDTLTANLPAGVTIDDLSLLTQGSQISLAGKSTNRYNVMNYGTTLQQLYPESIVTYEVESVKESLEEEQEVLSYVEYSMQIQFPESSESVATTETTQETVTEGEGQ